ncbi:regulatory protein RecX [Nonlabens xiamenensis]|uniref:regulatory protein RecX n=1 Tax=Nonlabens xiamenensis TaxID=2341043 RepID=UPI000F60B06D|nr:regulatory protein RecX [Nonlabens xiamenensis]
MPQTTYTVEEATRSIERYCAYQERCHQEVVDKLKKMGMIDLAIEEIVPHLIHHGFLNEARYAEAFARGKFRIKKWGKQRISRELKTKGLTERNIKQGLLQISEEDYLATFISLSRKRMEQLTSETDKFKKRKKLADYLLYRGWESYLVYERVKELIP